MNDWICVNVNQAKPLIVLPCHEARLHKDTVSLFGIEAEESLRDLEEGGTSDRLSDDPLLVLWIKIDMLLEIW